MRRPAVFLDRDNTIIHNDGDLGDPAAVRLIQGAGPAVASLCGLGYRVVVVTNQGGVARGKYTEEDVHAVHARIEALVTERANGARIEGFYFCPYHPEGKVSRYKMEHDDRKPRPGMLLRAAADLDLDLSQSWMIGDALRDIEAGAAAGTRTVLLQPDYVHDVSRDLRREAGAKPTGEAVDAGSAEVAGEGVVSPDFIAKNLVEAVRIVASQRKPEANEEMGRTRVAGKRWDAEAMKELQRPGRRSAAAKPPEDVPDAPTDTETKDVSNSNSAPAPVTDPPDLPQGNGHNIISAATTPRAPRPFRPWTVGPAEEDAVIPDQQEEESGAGAVPSTSASPSASKSVQGEIGGDELADMNQSLRLILAELRTQRGTSGEASHHHLVALILQALAGFCLLAGLWMGSGDGGTAVFWRWLGVALVVQLGSIAALLFKRG